MLKHFLVKFAAKVAFKPSTLFKTVILNFGCIQINSESFYTNTTTGPPSSMTSESGKGT